MAESNVVSLPGNARNHLAARRETHATAPLQREIFSFYTGSHGKFLFLNPGDMDQDSLCRTVMMNSAKGIIDFRAAPIFKAPRYRHREVIKFFASQQMRYAGVPFLTRSVEKHHSIFTASKLRDLFGELFQSGLLFILADNNLVRGVSISHVRNFIGKNFANAVEVTPSTVVHR